MVSTQGALRHILSADDLDLEFLLSLFKNAELFRDLFHNDEEDGRSKMNELLKGKLLKYIFFEPSSRTRMSFQDGAIHLGMNVSGTDMAGQFSSFAKNGQIEPEFRTMSGYKADIIIIRSKQAGDAKRAAEYSLAPIINGGDGSAEHPTQAILDLYTIWLEFRRLDNLTIGLGGDLKYGRTVHSLIRILSKFDGNSFVLVSPEEMALPNNYKNLLVSQGCDYKEFTSVADALPLADTWYWTRVQFERVELNDASIAEKLQVSLDKYKSWKKKKRRKRSQRVLDAEKERLFTIAQRYTIGGDELKRMKEKAILLHPQPIDERIKEIQWDVVKQGMQPNLEARDPLYRKVRIFEQSDNGLYVRMALIFWVIKGHHNTMLSMP